LLKDEDISTNRNAGWLSVTVGVANSTACDAESRLWAMSHSSSGGSSYCRCGLPASAAKVTQVTVLDRALGCQLVSRHISPDIPLPQSRFFTVMVGLNTCG